MQKERTHYLEEIARWQEIAQQMAHEIRRPLQPIMTWISNLKAAYSFPTDTQYELLLNEATVAPVLSIDSVVLVAANTTVEPVIVLVALLSHEPFTS